MTENATYAIRFTSAAEKEAFAGEVSAYAEAFGLSKGEVGARMASLLADDAAGARPAEIAGNIDAIERSLAVARANLRAIAEAYKGARDDEAAKSAAKIDAIAGQVSALAAERDGLEGRLAKAEAEARGLAEENGRLSRLLEEERAKSKVADALSAALAAIDPGARGRRRARPGRRGDGMAPRPGRRIRRRRPGRPSNERRQLKPTEESLWRPRKETRNGRSAA